MRYCKLLVITALSMAMLVSCNKNHYDVDNVNGINAEGEVLLPLVSKTTTMMDLMERFNIDSLISCTDDGSLYYELFYDCPEVVKGSELLRFNDLEYHQHFDIDTNYFQFVIPNIFDTVVKLDLPLRFESDYLKVWDAVMRSGRFDFDIQTNADVFLKKIIVRSPNIKDVFGNVVDFELSNGIFGFDVSGLHYNTEMENANQLNLNLELHLQLSWTDDPAFDFDIDIKGSDLGIREMTGSVYPTVFRGSIDTTYSFFPSNVSGQLNINDARLRISARNLFNLEARFEVDTALIYADDYEPYSLLDPLPDVTMLQELTMKEFYNRKFDCTIQAHNGRARCSYYFTLNPHGNANGVLTPVSVSDTCVIDLQFGVDVPFAFKASDVRYVDTVVFLLDNIEKPDLIESVTIDCDITSTLPLNLNGLFYLYDSQTGMITDTLNPDGKIIVASYNGQPTSTTVSVDITQDRLDNALRSDRIIMLYEVDTDARDVKLNAQQELGAFVKAIVKYDGVININN